MRLERNKKLNPTIEKKKSVSNTDGLSFFCNQGLSGKDD